MHASLARWAVVTCCVAGSVGCAGSRPSWWPGRRPAYSQSSQAAPQLPPYAQSSGGFTDQTSNSQYPAPSYPPQGGSPAAPAGYNQPAANGYNTAQDPYGQAGAMAANQQTGGYDAYGQASGAAADPYAAGNPYTAGAPTAQGYADYQGGQAGYAGQNYAGQQPYGNQQNYGGQSGAYQQPAASPYGGGASYTADSRAGGGYSADSPYGTAGNYGAPDGGQYNQAGQGAGQGAAWGAPQGGAATTDPGYQQPPAGGYNSQPAASPYQSSSNPYGDTSVAQQDPHYRPGSTGDYSPSSGAAASGAAAGGTAAGSGWGQAATATAGGAAYSQQRYPSTGMGAGSGAAPASTERYGRGTSTLNPDVGSPTVR